MMRNIKELALVELEALLDVWQAPRFYAKEICVWMYQKQAVEFCAMTNLPQALRARLAQHFYMRSAKVVQSVRSSDGTQKFLFAQEDARMVEAVSIPAQGRVTGCISSQVGCKFACVFCASGVNGFTRDLTSAEMLDEVLYLARHAGGTLSHLVFMGSGEPMDNYDNVMRAIRMLNAPYGVGIGARRITISTCGVVTGIDKLAQEKLQVELSVSLHAAEDALRSRLMPCNKKYPLKTLISACQKYTGFTKRQITFEYILIKGLNSDLHNAKKLSTIVKSVPLAKVNLIPANFVKELHIEPPEKRVIEAFYGHLVASGVKVTLRIPRGQDIDAACGQLRLRHEE
jgi:23S rRNA (adenine2503-C2)-methyltransferase